MNTWKAILLVVVGAMLAGCDKEVEITWVNHTFIERQLVVHEPDGDREEIGRLERNGGVRTEEFEFDDDDLPARVRWRAGDQRGEILVAEASPERLYIELLPGGPTPPRPWHGKFGRPPWHRPVPPPLPPYPYPRP